MFQIVVYFEKRWKYSCHFFSFVEAHSGDGIGDNGGNVAELALLQYLGDKELQIQSITRNNYF